MQPSQLSRLFAHCFWADQLFVDALERAPLPEAERLLAHVLATEHLYCLRITGADPFPQDFWPVLAPAERRELLGRNRADYLRLLADPIAQQAAASYRNSAGECFVTPVLDMLAHVPLHGMHHRGQIARAMRQAGVAPPAADFIVYARQHPVIDGPAAR